jgi:geranylgeranyl diphosphate synthase type I
MAVERSPDPADALVAPRERIDRALNRFLRDARAEMAGMAPEALAPIDEVIRLVEAGGKRLRPTFCYWGYRAAGGPEGSSIVRAAGALELLHTMALIHDDLMDDATERRGAPSSALWLADRARRAGTVDPDRVGRSLAILAGDLAAVLADRLFLGAGFDADRLVPALDRYHRMRTEMAAGQCLDVIGWRADPRAVASLKGGGYTVEGPLRIGAAIAGADPAVEEALARYGRPLGLAFQMRDDERDGDVSWEAAEVTALVDEAKGALSGELDREAVDVLRAVADLVGAG